MKRLQACWLALLALLVLPLTLSSQPTRPGSPDIHPDGTVTFHLKAPEAAKVLLNGDWPAGISGTSVHMVKDDQGVWSITVGPIKPDLWYYTFNVDGVKVPDDASVHFAYDEGYESPLFIPGPESYNYEVHDVPHGTVSQIWYPSPTLSQPRRRATVYTPPGYETSQERYPVLYLFYAEEIEWNTLGRASIILDNVIAAGKAKPMILVMCNVRSNVPASLDYIDEPLPSTMDLPAREVPRPMLPGQSPYATGAGGVGTSAMLTSGQSIAKDLVPFIDKTYRTVADRDHRAIAGLSSPGAEAFYTGMTNLKLFGSIGVFSGGFPTLPGVAVPIAAPPNADQLRGPDLKRTVDPEKIAALMPDMNAKANLHLLYLSVGANDPLITTHNVMKKLLDEKGVKYISMVEPGYYHQWRFWRWSLNDFVPRLFQDLHK